MMALGKKLDPSTFYAGAVYFILAAITLNADGLMRTPAGFPSIPFFLLCGVSFTILPWFMVRHTLGKLPNISFKTLALVISCVSVIGLVLATITAALGNKPGPDCYVIFALHGVILLLSLAALATAKKGGKSGAILLRLCSIVYFFCGWVMPMLEASARCGTDCTDAGWKVLGLNLFDLNVIVSVFMGFFVFMSVFKVRNSRGFGAA